MTDWMNPSFLQLADHPPVARGLSASLHPDQGCPLTSVTAGSCSWHGTAPSEAAKFSFKLSWSHISVSVGPRLLSVQPNLSVPAGAKTNPHTSWSPFRDGGDKANYLIASMLFKVSQMYQQTLQQ